MTNKLSFTKISTYKECPLKYKLRYVDKIYPDETKSSLVFGKCIDDGLNNLLLERDLDKALETFRLVWEPFKSQNIKYSKSDLDEDLISDNLTETNRAWYSLFKKGAYIIKAFNDNILPKVKKTILVQEQVTAYNEDGDEIVGALDAVIVWEDDKTYLIDNKTTSVKYTAESANESEQLALYHFIKKDELKLDGVAFFTMNKVLNKKTLKTCKSCGIVYKGSPVKYCKCGSEDLDKTFEFSVTTNVIFGKPSDEIESKTLEAFDQVNSELKKGIFKPNRKSCIGKYGKCDYYDYCKYGGEHGYTQKKSTE
jgi:hypothetical protein